MYPFHKSWGTCNIMERVITFTKSTVHAAVVLEVL